MTEPAPPPQGGVQASTTLVRADVIGTTIFVIAVALGIPLHDHRPIQVMFVVVSMVLFAIGAAGCLWAYISALERSRADEIGVANLYMLTGPTAPGPIKRTMTLALAAQSVLALTGAIVGAAGLSGNQVNALAFGILVPMFGLAMNALWAVRHGRFGPRLDQSVQPSNRKIG
ncbi:MAG: hypothetical protein JWN99_3106 [Ilumatobacteraceae bacterium]|nr:hypothetical protein [Ilumatobacteraceae bacterium]